MITCDDCYDAEQSSVKKFFSNKDAIGFYEWCDWSAEKGLERLVFQVTRKTNNLESHLERIYYCFQNDLKEQLYGALFDLMIVLNKNGITLAKRMVLGASAKLTELQFRTLSDLIENNLSGLNQPPGNQYSVFSKGLRSTAVLLQINEEHSEQSHDPLVLAREYVEFSQLQDAVRVLEEAIMVHPERFDLHDELLSLYRSTGIVSGFNRLYKILSDKKLALSPKWKQLDDFFIRNNKHGE
jgi:hypothetical protein